MLTAQQKKEVQHSRSILNECILQAQKNISNKAVVFGNFVDVAVASFLRQGFVLAGTDMKHKKLSKREVMMCNKDNTVVLISENYVSQVITRIDVINYAL